MTTNPTPSQDPRTDEPTPGQVILVRRGRRPALGLWVLIALALPFVVGMIVAWCVDVRTPTGMLYFGFTGAVMLGLPLAAVAAYVDSLADRRRRSAPASSDGGALSPPVAS